MGLTIHFQGTLRSKDDLNAVLQRGREFARRKRVEVFEIQSRDQFFATEANGEIRHYTEEVNGILFRIHPECEPLKLWFTRDLFIQAFCKTLFAGVSVHIEIVEFLREIERHFRELSVFDEGKFWETSDISVLEQRFEDYSDAFNALFDALNADGYIEDGYIEDDGEHSDDNWFDRESEDSGDDELY